MSKLEKCRRSLTEWSRKEFKNKLIEINKVEKKKLKNLGDHNIQPNDVD